MLSPVLQGPRTQILHKAKIQSVIKPQSIISSRNEDVVKERLNEETHGESIELPDLADSMTDHRVSSNITGDNKQEFQHQKDIGGISSLLDFHKAR